MSNLALYGSALLICLKPINLVLIFAMVALGIVFGAIPGLSATLGIALLLPVTFGLSTETSFVLLLAIWIGGVSGSFISAVLIGIPGSSSAIATCFDGYPMTLRGESNKALAIGITASFLGTVFSVLIADATSDKQAGQGTDRQAHRRERRALLKQAPRRPPDASWNQAGSHHPIQKKPPARNPLRQKAGPQ